MNIIEVQDRFDKSSAEADLIDHLAWHLCKMEAAGLVVTVERRPLLPLAMGRHEPAVTVRRAIDHKGEAAKRGGYATVRVKVDMIGKDLAGDTRHAQTVMRELGISYTRAEPFPIGDAWIFHGVEFAKLPAELPDYVEVLK